MYDVWCTVYSIRYAVYDICYICMYIYLYLSIYLSLSLSLSLSIYIYIYIYTKFRRGGSDSQGPVSSYKPFRRVPQSLRKTIFCGFPCPSRLSLHFRMLQNRQITQNRPKKLSGVCPKSSKKSTTRRPLPWRVPQSLRKPFFCKSSCPNRLSLYFRMLLHRQMTQNRSGNLSRVSPKSSRKSTTWGPLPWQVPQSLRKPFFCKSPCPIRSSLSFSSLHLCPMHANRPNFLRWHQNVMFIKSSSSMDIDGSTLVYVYIYI